MKLLIYIEQSEIFEKMVSHSQVNPGTGGTTYTALRLAFELNNEYKFAKSSKFPDIQTFKDLNYSSKTPKADNLLKEMEKPEFDENQKTLEIKGY